MFIYIYMCVQDSETENCGTVSGGNIHKIVILMEVKTQEQILKLFSECAVIIHYVMENGENQHTSVRRSEIAFPSVRRSMVK